MKSLDDGSLLSPSEYFKSEPTSGIYREVTTPTTTAIAFSKKGTKRLRITDSGVDVTGTLTASSFVPVQSSLPDGSASAPSLSFTSSTNSGYYWDTSGSEAGQAWSVGGTKKLKLDSKT